MSGLRLCYERLIVGGSRTIGRSRTIGGSLTNGGSRANTSETIIVSGVFVRFRVFSDVFLAFSAVFLTFPAVFWHEQHLEMLRRIAQVSSNTVVYEPSYGRLSAWYASSAHDHQP